MNKTILDVSGMHCKSCEILIEDNLKKISGIRKVHASTKSKKVVIVSEEPIKMTKVSDILEKLGYSLKKEALPYVSKNVDDYKNLLTAIIFLAAVYLLLKAFDINQILPQYGSNDATLPVVFMIGLTAGFSTCMALVGGLVLGISTKHAEKHPDATLTQKFRPHIFFSLGRIISYFVLGGLIGALGQIFKLSSFGFGLITLVVGLYMLFLGLQIIGIFPRLTKAPTIPKFVSKIFRMKGKEEKEYSHRNSFLLGALTFFLPCGFTQAMQVYAISTGKFTTGALIMGIFAIGTTPGLLGIGGITSYLKKGFISRLFFKFIGLTVILFSFFNITNGLNLTGLKNIFRTPDTQTEQISSESNEGFQVLSATYNSKNGIKPSAFKVKAGKSVRLEILAEEDGVGCMGSVMIPGLVREPQFFEKGKTAVLEFIPKNKGKYQITCAMGIPAGTIEVE